MQMNLKSRASRSYIIDEIHRCNIFLEGREIFLHSHLDDASSDDSGIDFRVSNNFIKNIRLLEKISSEPIVIHQHSIGGHIEEGMMIYDCIKTAKSYIIMITHGIAASMGSIIPQAADLIITMPSCSWMIHDGSIGFEEITHKQSVALIEQSKIHQKQTMQIYVDSCSKKSELFKGKTDLQIYNALRKELDRKGDWWLSAEDAVEFGFCDGIYGSKQYPDLESIIKNVC